MNPLNDALTRIPCLVIAILIPISDMQECDLYGKIESRRIDKIVYIIHTRTLARFHFSYLAKQSGRKPNAAAILLVNQAILKANDRDLSNPGAVTSLSAYEFTVASA
jgi:hypothetical protein